jgi:hypothetical protein
MLLITDPRGQQHRALRSEHVHVQFLITRCMNTMISWLKHPNIGEGHGLQNLSHCMLLQQQQRWG